MIITEVKMIQNLVLISMRHGGENTSSFDLRVKMFILPQYRLKLDKGE